MASAALTRRNNEPFGRINDAVARRLSSGSRTKINVAAPPDESTRFTGGRKRAGGEFGVAMFPPDMDSSAYATEGDPSNAAITLTCQISVESNLCSGFLGGGDMLFTIKGAVIRPDDDFLDYVPAVQREPLALNITSLNFLLAKDATNNAPILNSSDDVANKVRFFGVFHSPDAPDELDELLGKNYLDVAIGIKGRFKVNDLFPKAPVGTHLNVVFTRQYMPEKMQFELNHKMPLTGAQPIAGLNMAKTMWVAKALATEGPIKPDELKYTLGASVHYGVAYPIGLIEFASVHPPNESTVLSAHQNIASLKACQLVDATIFPSHVPVLI
jgi:hypothetical protein